MNIYSLIGKRATANGNNGEMRCRTWSASGSNYPFCCPWNSLTGLVSFNTSLGEALHVPVNDPIQLPILRNNSGKTGADPGSRSHCSGSAFQIKQLTTLTGTVCFPHIQESHYKVQDAHFYAVVVCEDS